MKLHKLAKTTKSRKRVSRGIAAGQGKTAGRGTKGQKSRSGYKFRLGFEGGQSPLFARLPKVKGAKFLKHKPKIALNLGDVERICQDGDVLDAKFLVEKKLIKNPKTRIKILSDGELTKRVNLDNCSISKNAQKKLDSKKIKK